jgi:hypothetical protein
MAREMRVIDDVNRGVKERVETGSDRALDGISS